MTPARHFATRLLLLAVALMPVVALPDAMLLSEPRREVPSWIIQLPDSVGDVLVAETDTATMYRFKPGAGGLVEADRRYMSIGQNGPGKERAWDRRTPLGVYFITERLDASRLNDKYGVAAFPLDYPNTWDRLQHRTGYGIWLHGVDPQHPDRPPRDTDGCLALPNNEILKLADLLQPLKTPVIVGRRLKWTSARSADELRREFAAALDRWRTSYENEDVYGYLSLYAQDFRYQDMDLAAWSSYRMNVFAARPLDSVAIKDVMLVADPEEPNLYLSRFTQVLRTGDERVATTHRLYWRRSADGWKIVAEDAG